MAKVKSDLITSKELQGLLPYLAGDNVLSQLGYLSEWFVQLVNRTALIPEERAVILRDLRVYGLRGGSANEKK
jgi:hypothetical protein